ncbi:MAG: RsmD family RNA methyltransferase, partial [Acidobacteriota bacterium]|nr:RsmD family RNA methyltransferase [Acidobacteriota bacterium]
LFRILYRRVRAHRFLDICAGTGTVGIEAISRGALLATMVERKAKNCSLIRKNLTALEISEGHGEIVESEAIPFLKQMSKRRRFWDVVFFSPPFDYDYDEALACFGRGFSIKPGGVFVIEHHAEMFFPERIGVLKRWKVVVEEEDERAISFYDRDK